MSSVAKGEKTAKRLTWEKINGGRAKVAEIGICGSLLRIAVGKVGVGKDQWMWEFGIMGKLGQGRATTERGAKLLAVMAMRDYINRERYVAIDKLFAEEAALILRGAGK